MSVFIFPRKRIGWSEKSAQSPEEFEIQIYPDQSPAAPPHHRLWRRRSATEREDAKNWWESIPSPFVSSPPPSQSLLSSPFTSTLTHLPHRRRRRRYLSIHRPASSGRTFWLDLHRRQTLPSSPASVSHIGDISSVSVLDFVSTTRRLISMLYSSCDDFRSKVWWLCRDYAITSMLVNRCFDALVQKFSASILMLGWFL